MANIKISKDALELVTGVAKGIWSLFKLNYQSVDNITVEKEETGIDNGRA